MKKKETLIQIFFIISGLDQPTSRIEELKKEKQ
jgi:hypothetical protein